MRESWNKDRDGGMEMEMEREGREMGREGEDQRRLQHNVGIASMEGMCRP